MSVNVQATGVVRVWSDTILDYLTRKPNPFKSHSLSKVSFTQFLCFYYLGLNGFPLIRQVLWIGT